MEPTLGSGVGAAWQPHGRAVVRTTGHGGRVVVIPTCCPSGLHVLSVVGYTAHEGEYPAGAFGRILWVRCEACSTRSCARADHSWAFMLGDQRVDAAEFDDAPHVELVARVRDR